MSEETETELHIDCKQPKEQTKEKKKEKQTASLGQLFRTATCLDILLMVIGSIAANVHGAGIPVLFLFFGGMTDTFIAGPGGNNESSFNKSSQDILDTYNSEMTKYSLYYVYIGVVVFASSYIQNSFWTIACERQVHRIRKQFCYAILRQEIAWFDVHQSGELTTRLTDDLDKVRDGLGNKFSFIIQFFAEFCCGFAIGFWKGWKLALVMMSLTPLLAICGGFNSMLLANYTRREQDTYAAAGSVAAEVISCIRTVTSFNGQNQDIKRYEKSLEDCKKLGIKKSWISGIGLGVTYLMLFSAYALSLWYGTEQVKDWYKSEHTEGISPGTVLTVFFCLLMGTVSVGNITPHLSTVAASKGAAAELIDIIDNKPTIDASSTCGQVLQNVIGEIEIRGVNFTYPSRKEVQVLKNFNLMVKPGQTVAIVGASGCGKSTVVNLIQRFYDPDEGLVMVDGVNVKDLNLESLRRNIGVVSQEPILFGFTIKENILLGRPDARYDEVVQAALEANCHDFISKLPQGYDTLVGERGAHLSGGQKQIARAIVRDPKILLLDEATSALDSESERIVQEALDKARKGRTTVVIAHRLSTIQNADVIYVVQDGEVIESGKHLDLMANKAAYCQLVTVQMLEEKENDSENEDEIEDLVPNGFTRQRTLSERTTHRQVSKQVSKKVSIQEEERKKNEEDKEIAPSAKFFPLFRENVTEWPYILTGCLTSGIIGCTVPIFAIFCGGIIKVFINKGENNLFWSMMFLVLGGAHFFMQTIQSVSFGHSGEKLTMRLRLKTFRAILRQNISYFDDPKHSTGALTTRLATDASQVKNATGVRIGTMVQSVFGMIAALGISFAYGWQLALVVLAGVPLIAVAGILQLQTFMGNQKKNTEELESAGKIASEAIENIRTVQALSREPYFYDKYVTFLRKPYRTNQKLTQLQGIAFGFSQGIVFIIYAGAFRFGAYMVSVDQMSPENVFKVYLALQLTGALIGHASSLLPDYAKASTAAGLVFKTIETVPPIDVFSTTGQQLSKISGSVEFKDVYFHYPMRPNVQVLKGINIKVVPDQTVALVGQSGCGKSTVVSLLQRFYDAHQGSIEINGVNIKDINLVNLRNLISVVSQEPVLFNCSIKDNITYGIDSPISMDAVMAAARTCNIHVFISSLPLGYDTMVGEKGTQLSGGQKQRVAIARALVRNPRILLLDEATSALDTESEKMVQAALDNAKVGRTCIVVAHRLSTIQGADVIYVIDSGQVVEYGNHQQLLNKNGVYAQLVSGQQLSK